ncbi:ABC transporter ATP-binding protein [Amycolatopsis jejuensis]|uniref:ABC transporter ATP-binding protein n=1 Tax=Amycolatopsis jejuensis TaxID=330084 RepID=UPI0005245ECC|nr:ABC transporter ATP-binding protein [Amycolatopsis jejuensis]
MAGNGGARVPKLQAAGLGMTFQRRADTVTVLRGLDFEVHEGEFVSIVGPSGCGKSTILNLAAGLLTPSAGRLAYDGKGVPQPNTRVGYVTQKDNLLPWRSVRKNISVALEIRKRPRDEIKERTAELVDLVGLQGFENAYPAQLSGGMRKRVTLARTLAYRPDMILADEPFGALDAQLRLVLQEELLRIWQHEKNTIVFITHDITEAIALSDRVLVFSKRPARVKVDCPIDLPRPRDLARVRTDPAFDRLYDRLWTELAEDIEAGDAL